MSRERALELFSDVDDGEMRGDNSTRLESVARQSEDVFDLGFGSGRQRELRVDRCPRGGLRLSGAAVAPATR